MRVLSSYALLTGRRALVTGAAGGLGQAIVGQLRTAGAEVVGLDLVTSPRQQVVPCDVTDEAQVKVAFDEAGVLTDVVHAAGVVAVGPVRDLALAEWKRILEVNLTGSFIVAREAARRLPPGGTLTLISSQAGKRGGALWAAYCASKFGVVGLGQCLAQELAPARIRVNLVCPGSVDTPMTESAFQELARHSGQDLNEVRRRQTENIPLGRLADAEEVGRVCVFLASELSSYMAGSSIIADGGELTS